MLHSAHVQLTLIRDIPIVIPPRTIVKTTAGHPDAVGQLRIHQVGRIADSLKKKCAIVIDFFCPISTFLVGFGWAPANCDRSLVGDGGVTIGLMADDIGNELLSLNEPVTISLMTVTPSERERVMDCIVKVAILVIEYTKSVRTRVLPEQIGIYTTFRLLGDLLSGRSVGINGNIRILEFQSRCGAESADPLT